MPEAPVDEYRDPLSPEDEIWPHDQLSLALALCNPRPERELDDKVSSPSLDASPSEGRCKRQFGRLVAFPADPGHDLGALLGVKNVCHQASPKLRLALGQVRCCR